MKNCRPDKLPYWSGTKLACAFALLLAGITNACADDETPEPSVTPYRPTVSNPADLPVPGWLEGEFGGLRTLGEDHSRDDSVPWLLKYAFDENRGLLLGGNAYARAQPPGAAGQSSFGDTFVEWKQRFPVSDKTAFGIEAGVVVPTASHGLGIGTPQWVANGILSTDLGAVHLDMNLGEMRGGDEPANVSRWQTTWAAAVSTSLTDQWGTAFELSGSHQRGAATASQALLAFTYNVSHRLVLDAGGTCGLTHEAHDRGFFAGATVLIGQLR
jgi:hypothetical protein